MYVQITKFFSRGIFPSGAAPALILYFLTALPALALPGPEGEVYFQADLEVVPASEPGGSVEALVVRSGEAETRIPLDFAHETISGEDGDGERIHLYRDLLGRIKSNGALDFELVGSGIASWNLENTVTLLPEALASTQVLNIQPHYDAEQGGTSFDLSFSRSVDTAFTPSDFSLYPVDTDTGTNPTIHLAVERIDSRRIRLHPQSGGALEGLYALVFSGSVADRFGQSLEPFQRRIEVDPPEEGTPGAETADIGPEGSISLPLVESPTGTGLLTAFTSGTFDNVGRDYRKTFEVELEGGDQLSVYIDFINPSAIYRLRVEDSSGNDLAGGYWGTYGPIQRLQIPVAGTYRVQAYSQSQTTDFDLRIDVGRNLFLEAENNDSPGSSNHVTFRPASGGYQEQAAGALSDLESNSSWGGSNDVNGDFFDLGYLSTGNSMDVTYQLPADSTLGSGDLELALFAAGGETPVAISTAPGGLSTTVPADGQYFLRIAPDDNLDGTSLEFAGGTDRVDLPAAALDGLNTFTLEFWARGRTDGRGLISAANNSEDNEILVYFLNETGIRLHDRGPSYDWTVPRMDAQTWRHFAFVRDGTSGTVELFVDGVSQGSQAGQSSPLNVISFLLGQDQDSVGGGFDTRQAHIGHLDDLRIWSILRTPTEIDANQKTVLTGSEAGLEAYYRFNEGTGTTVFDETANSHDGTLVGPVFDGDVNAAGFNPARLGIRAQYHASITVIDSVNPSVVETSFPETSGDGYFTSFSVTFSEDLNPETAQIGANYELRSSGPDGVMDTPDDELYTIEPQPYIGGNTLTFFLPDGPMQPGDYRFRAGSAIEDRGGNSLIPYEETFTLVPLGDFIIENRDNDSPWTATDIGPLASADHNGSFRLAGSTVAINPVWSASVMLDGDAYPDLLVINDASYDLEVYLNNGDGTFTPGNAYDLVGFSREAVLADLDNDGNEDIAVAIRSDDNVRVFFNNGDGTVTAGPVIAVGDGPRGIAAGDLDGDGIPDLATTNQYDGSLSILLNSGNGSAFSVSSLPEPGADPHRLVIDTFDTDPGLDIVYTDFSNQRVGFLSGNNDGTFAPVVYSGVDPEEANPSDIDAADLDGDGILDIVVAHNASWQTSNAAVLYGNGDGSFMGLRRFYTDSYRSEIYLEDINDDGIPDFLVGNRYSTRYYLGTGDREAPFGGSVVFFNYDDAYGIAIDDFDLDGRTDLVLGEPNDNALLFLAGNAVNRPLADATAPGFHQALGRGNLRDTDDVDWYAFTAREGERIVLLTENANPGDSSARLRFQIYGPGINSKINTTSSWTGGRLQTDPYTATADGTYYVRVSRSQNYFSEYRFRITIAPPDYQLEDESNDRISDGTPLAFAQTAGQRSANVLGQFMPGDSSGDFYRIGNLAAGTQVELTYTNTEDSTATPKLWLYSDDGSFSGVIIAEEAEGNASLPFTTTADGTYLARVTAPNEDLDFFSEYRLSVVLTDTDPPAIVSDTLPAEGSTSDDLLIALTLNFNEDLEAASVNDAASFELRGAGGDGLFNTPDDFLVPLGNFTYTSGLSQLLTIGTNPLQPGAYRFTAFSGGIQDLFGNTLPTPYVRQFTITGLPGYISESTDNDTLKTADPLTTNPPGNLTGSFTYASAGAITSDNPQGLRLVDVDNDGLRDAVVASAYDDRLRVYFSNGDGTFTEGPDYPIGNEVYFMEKADVDGDGYEDILLAERDSSSGLRLFRNNADGTLTDLGLLPGGINPSGMAAGDLDGTDGIDLVMANLGSSTNGNISLFLQQPDGSFSDTLLLDGLGIRVRDVDVGAFNADPHLDIAFAEYQNRRVGLLFGNGDGTFQDPVYYPLEDVEVGMMTAGDFDNDGHRDLAVAHQNHNQVSILLNNADGTFAPFESVSLGNNRSGRLEAHDLDGDGAPDLILTGDFGIGWRYGATDGSLFPGQLYFGDPSGNHSMRDLDVADVDEDGLADIVTVGWNTDSLIIFLGDPEYTLADTAGFPELFEVFGRGRDIVGANNEDYYTFSATAGQQLLLDVENDVSQWASHNFTLYDAFGEQIESQTLFNGYEQMTPVTIPRTGNYYLRAIGNDGHDDIYRFRISLVDAQTQLESEANNRYSQSDNLTFSEAPGIRAARVFATAPAGEDDSDWFGIGNLAENAQITVTFDQPADSNLIPTLSLRASNGSETRVSGAAGDTSITYTLNAGEEDFHWVVVSHDGQNFRGRYFLDVAIEDLQAPEITGLTLPDEGATTSRFIVGGRLSFSEDLQPEGVTDPASYELINAGPDAIFGTADDIPYTVNPKAYTSGLSVDLAIEEEPLQPGLYRFRIPAAALRDLFGNTLEADFERTFFVEGVVPYVSESSSNDLFQEADSVSINPTGTHSGSFFIGQTWTTAQEPRAIVPLDADGDGHLDVLVAAGDGEVDLQLFLNDGAGGFLAPETLLSSSWPNEASDLVSADFDQDGIADVALSIEVISGTLGSRVVWLLGNGDGTFTEVHSDADPVQPRALASDDLDGDGWPDLLAVEASGSPRALSVFLNDGTGTGFTRTPFTDLGENASPQGIAIADFDADGVPDIAVADNANDTIILLKGGGDGTFHRTGSAALPTEAPLYVRAGDLDGDGIPDLVVSYSASSSIDVLTGNGDLTFASPIASPLRNFENHSDLLVEDLNGDGLLDVVAGTRRTDGFTVFLGQRGSGHFLSGPQAYEEFRYTSSLASGDFDGDGLLDLVAVDFFDDRLALYSGLGDLPLTVDNAVVGLRYGMARGTMRHGTTNSEIDHWTFSGRAGDRLLISSENTSTARLTDVSYQLYSPGGDRLVTWGSARFGGEGQTPPFTLEYSGRYVLVASDTFSEGDEYRLNFNLVPAPAQIESEDNDQASQADGPVFESTPGRQTARVFGIIDRRDTSGDHFFLGNLDGGTTIQVRLTLPDNSLLDPRLQIYRGGDAPLAETTTSTPALDASVPNDAPGAYYARIDGTASARGLRASYLADLTLLDTVPPEIVSTSLPTTPSSAIYSTIELELNEDFDPASVNDPAAFELIEAGPDGLFGTADDIIAPIGDPAYSGGSTITLPLTDNPLPAGTYRFTAFQSLRDNARNNLTDDFVQTFTMIPLPGFITETIGNSTPETATALLLDPVLDGIASKGGRGRLTTSNEEDYWTFSASSGQRLVLATDFPGDPRFSGLQFLVTAPDGTTTIVGQASDNDGAFVTSGLIPLDQTGEYSLRVVRGVYAYTGEYRFRVTLVDDGTDWEEEPNNSLATANSFTLASTVDGLSGTFLGTVSSPVDRDYVSLGTVAPGNTLFLSVLPSANGPLVPVVSVYRADAATGDEIFIAEVPSGRNGDSVVEIDVTEEHEYFALVRGSSSTGSLMSEYELSVQILPTDLANFPNLQVTSVTLPAGPGISSGDTVSFSFTVTNAGADPTNVSSWIDRAVISSNNIFGDGDDFQLAVVNRESILAAGDSYTVTTSATLPDGISGSFFLIVRTDTADQVDEFLFEGDNELASIGTFSIGLSDYPDLVVENLVIPDPTVTGDLTISWNTANRGAAGVGQPFIERVELVDRITRGIVYASNDVISDTIPVDGAVARSVSFNGLIPSNYRIRILTDQGDDFFEYGPSGHEAAEENLFSGDFIVHRFFDVATFSSPVEGGTTLGAGLVREGSSVTVTAEADTSLKPYRFVRWKSAAGALLTTDPAYNFVPDANIDLIAEFELPLFTLQTSQNLAPAGTVSGAGGYRWGSVIAVRARPNPGYLFERFENAADASVLGTDPDLSVTVTEDLAIRAIFAEKNPVHDVTVLTDPAGIASPGGSGTYANGETLALSVPATIVDLPREYIFQRWTLNGQTFSGNREASKTFSTLDAPVIDFVAEYQMRSFNPEVVDLTSLVRTDVPVPGGAVFGVTLTFDREMDTSIEPTLTLASANAAVVPSLGGGRWLDSRRWESGTLTFVSDNTGDYTLEVSVARGTDGRTADPTIILTFAVDATPPENPVLALASTGDGTATIEWNSYSPPADLKNFRIYLDQSIYTTVVPAGSVSSVAGSSRQFSFSGLDLDTDHFAAVVAVDTSGNANNTVAPLLFRIESTLPPPVNPTLVVLGSDQARLDWSSYETSALIGFDGFMVFRETTPFTDVDGLTPVATLAPDTFTHETGSLDRAETYYFAVVGFNRAGQFDPAVGTVSWSDPLAGSIATDLTFGGAAEPSIEVLSPMTLVDGATLTLLPGTTLSFAPGAGIVVEEGRLLAAGDPLAPIVLTSSSDDGTAPSPQPGDWAGIDLRDPVSPSLLEHVWIQYGSGLEVAGANPVVSALGLVHNLGTALTVSGGKSFTGNGLYLAFNDIGLETVDSGSSAELGGSVIISNATLAARAGTGTSILATGNWWGTDDAVAIGARIEGTVDAGGNLGEEPLLGLGFALDAPILQTTNDEVELLLGAMNAAAYRVSEDSTFADVPFIELHPDSATSFVLTQPWEQTFTLSEGAGTKTLFAEFLSPSGGASEQLQLDLTLIDEGPEISGWNISEGDTLARPFIVDASGTSPVGIAEVRMEVDGATELSTPAAALSERWDLSGFQSGIYRLRLVVEDLSGNLATRAINVTIDPLPPERPVLSSPADDVLLALDTVDVTGVAEPETSVRVSINGNRIDSMVTDAAGNFSFSAVPLIEGDNSLVVTAYDDAGSTASLARTVTSDTQSPIAPVMEEPLYDPETGLLLQWRLADAEGEQPVRFKVFWDPEPISDTSTALGASDIIEDQNFAFEDQPNREYFFRVVGYDAANNASPASNEVSAFFDDTPPVIEVFYDKPMPVGSGDLRITLESNEPLNDIPSLTIRPEGRRLPIAVPLTETAAQTWEAVFTVSDISMRSGTANVLLTARDEDSNLYSGPPVGPELLVDLTRPTGILRTNIASPLQVLNPRQIELTLELSEPVKPGTTPGLRWSPPTGAEVGISLSGAEDVWTGTLTLFPEMGKGDGIFLLEVTDAVGNEGTLLTEGGTYEIYNTLLPDPPGRPAQLLAAARSGGRVELVWQEAYRADTYNVYRVPAAQSGTPNFLVAEGIAETDFIDLPPEDGQYRYVVTASRLGAEGDPSPAFTVTSDRTPPPPPENISVELGVNGVVVRYDPPSGGEVPDHYVLYRNGTALNVRSPVPLELRDFPPRGVMEYQVASSDVYGNHALTGVASIEMFLGPVKDVEVLVEGNEPVRIVWDKTDVITEGYNLYRNGTRQNAAILTSPFYSDPLPVGGQPVTYAVTAVNEQGQESAPRQIIVQPMAMDFLLNEDEDGAEQPSVTGFFDSYTVAFDNSWGDAVIDLASIRFSRELSTGETLLRNRDLDLAVPAGGEAETLQVIPSPLEDGFTQTTTVTAATEPGPGGGVVRYRKSRELDPASGSGSPISLSAAEAPLAGGVTDFSVTFTNRGRTEADLVLVRDSGAEPGEFSISVFNEDGQEVSVTLFEDFISGLTLNAAGDGFFRLDPGESVSFPIPEVFVPITLADAGEAEFVGTLETLYYRVGSSDEDETGPLRGLMGSNLTETPYSGTSSTARDIYSDDETITITGQALERDSGLPVANVPLRLGFEVQGFTFYRDISTDGNGDYSYDYDPTPGVGGEIHIWAAHPDVIDQIDQTTIVLYRSFLSPVGADIRMSKNDFADFEIQLINVGDRSLSDFTVSTRAYTVDENGAETEIDSLVASLREPIRSPVSGRRKAPVKLRLTSDLNAPDDAVVEISVTSVEGASSTFTGSVSLLPAIPILDVVSPRVGYVDLTVNKGDIVSRQVTMTNRGLRPLEDVVLTPPQDLPWMQVTLPTDPNGEIRLPDLGVGDTFTFTVVYTPPEETEVGFYDDFILVSGSNAVADFRVNLFAQVSSSESGDVEFYVDNNLVLPIPNATIRMRNVALGIERGPIYTDANGYANFEDVQEGKWSWTVTAPSHDSLAGTVNVVADQTNGVDVRLGKSLVSIKFSVVPVPFTDRYEIKLEQTFETRVPSPVIVYDPPQFDFETNDPFELDVVFTLTNHGLISVFDVDVTGASNDRAQLIPLIDYLPELKAQETVEIPAKLVFYGFGEAAIDGPGGSLAGARPQISYNPLSMCDGPGSDEDFVQGIAALVRMAARAEFACPDGAPGVAGAAAIVTLKSLETVNAIKDFPTNPKDLAIALVTEALKCMDLSFLYGDPGKGGGSGPPPTSGPTTSGSGDACFVAGTLVQMADGSERPIESLRRGDRVISDVDGYESEIVQAYSLVVDETLTLVLSDGNEMTTTPEHRIWVDGTGWRPAGELAEGDWLQTREGCFVQVAGLEATVGPTRVYTFQLKGDNAFFANGILVEDLCGGQNLAPGHFAKLTPLGQVKGGQP